MDWEAVTSKIDQARSATLELRRTGKDLNRVTREEFKRDTLTRMRRAFRLPLIESWVATCALRDDMSGAELHGVPGANPWAGEWLAEQSA